MTRRAKEIEKAIKTQKEKYGGLCIKTMLPGTQGCHVYPRSPFTELAALPENILPINGIDHVDFDSKYIDGKLKKRPVVDRFLWLAAFTHPDVRAQVREQLRNLQIRVHEIWGEAKFARFHQ